MKSEKIGLGKASRDVLGKHVLPHLPRISAPSLDSTVVKFEEKSLAVTVNPGLGVPVECLGFFAFHYAASNLAVAFAKPRYAVVCMLFPPNFEVDKLELVAREFGSECRKYGVKVLAGHTGAYKGVSLPIVVSTMMGPRVRKPGEVRLGDAVCVVGEVGREAYWLIELSRGRELGEDFWRTLTPLPAALELQKHDFVKLMHDVSEGGLIGSLLEVAQHLGIGIKVESSRVPVFRKVAEMGRKVLRAPSYGSLIAVVDRGSTEDFLEVCDSIGVQGSVIGEVVEQCGLVVDGEVVERAERTEVDELYGAF